MLYLPASICALLSVVFNETSILIKEKLGFHSNMPFSVVLSWRDVRTNYTQIQPRSSAVSFTDHLRNTTLGYVIIKSGLSMHPLLHSLLAPLSGIIVFVLGNQPPPLFLPGVLLSKTCGEQLALKIHLLLRTSALWG